MYLNGRNCPLCNGKSFGLGYPYQTSFNFKLYKYLSCNDCNSVYVDPVPDKLTFTKMYSQSEYHNYYYQEDIDINEYRISVAFLKKYTIFGSNILDYGCGMGHFIIALKEQEFDAIGVEFDSELAKNTSNRINCEIISVDEFNNDKKNIKFDAIHFGDVLEHLPDPSLTLLSILNNLKNGGLIYAEGPLERNPSPVFWARSIIGKVKHFINPNFLDNHPPRHLYFTGSKQQQEFFFRISPKIKLVHWEVFETGWPYNSKGIRKIIANFAMKIGGIKVFNIIFGNKYRGIFSYHE